MKKLLIALIAFMMASPVFAEESRIAELEAEVAALQEEIAQIKENYVTKDEIAELIEAFAGDFSIIPETKEEVTAEEEVPAEEVTVSDDNTYSADGFTFTYLKNEIYTASDGTEYALVYYEFTNDSGNTVSPYWSLSTRAFQNGIQLTAATLFGTDIRELELAETQIRTGTTVTIALAYKLDDHSNLILEISPMMISADTPIFEKEIELTE